MSSRAPALPRSRAPRSLFVYSSIRLHASLYVYHRVHSPSTIRPPRPRPRPRPRPPRPPRPPRLRARNNLSTALLSANVASNRPPPNRRLNVHKKHPALVLRAQSPDPSFPRSYIAPPARSTLSVSRSASPSASLPKFAQSKRMRCPFGSSIDRRTCSAHARSSSESSARAGSSTTATARRWRARAGDSARASSISPSSTARVVSVVLVVGAASMRS